MEIGPARADERVAARGILDAAMLEVDDGALADGTLLVAREDGRVLGALVLEGREAERREAERSVASERPSGDERREAERSEVPRDSEAPERASGARFGATSGPASAEVVAVAVRPRRRGQGVGSALVRAAADRRDELTATFDPDVRPFYESLGFEVEFEGDRCRGSLVRPGRR